MSRISPRTLLSEAEELRRRASEVLREDRGDRGQFFTPEAVARFMAAMFRPRCGDVRLLDAGAGSGALTAAYVEAALSWKEPPSSIAVTAYENDLALRPYLADTISLCRTTCEEAGVTFSSRIMDSDFVEDGARSVADLFGAQRGFNAAIMNPPYKKIRTDSDTRRHLRHAGIETSNIYAGFVALAVKLLDPDSEIVAITPRSFCNGPYFRPFRELLLGSVALERLHVFDSRKRAFKDSQVLQENVIMHATVGGKQGRVAVSSSATASDVLCSLRMTPIEEVVYPGDPQRFIHLATDEMGSGVARTMGALPCTLSELGLAVSTGRVVDFRAKEHLLKEPEDGAVPLIYPGNIEDGVVSWPRDLRKKAQAIVRKDATEDLFLPNGVYVLTKRFTSKEERRRVVAALHVPDLVCAEVIGFENHLNVFHQNHEGLARNLAKGLAVFLNSTTVDLYFRLFNGHTQVNATDLRSLRYPNREQLDALGRSVPDPLLPQEQIDALVGKVVFGEAM